MDTREVPQSGTNPPEVNNGGARTEWSRWQVRRGSPTLPRRSDTAMSVKLDVEAAFSGHVGAVFLSNE